MSLVFLERLLAEEMAKRGRAELMNQAVGSISLTDDGSTVYVHLFPRIDWPNRLPGRAYVLSWQDYAGSQHLDCYRWLVNEARINLIDHVVDIIRWLDGR